MGRRMAPTGARARVRRSTQSHPLGSAFPGPEHLSRHFNEPAERFQQQASTEKQYVSEISHELRAPISRIRILLDRARQCPQEIYSYLAQIEENVLRMQALTKGLLDFSSVDLIGGAR